MTRVDQSLNDDEIGTLHGIDILRHARKDPWGHGLCLDGSLEGDIVYCANELGAQIWTSPDAKRSVGACYEVTALGTHGGLAELRLIGEGSPPLLRSEDHP